MMLTGLMGCTKYADPRNPIIIEPLSKHTLKQLKVCELDRRARQELIDIQVGAYQTQKRTPSTFTKFTGFNLSGIWSWVVGLFSWLF